MIAAILYDIVKGEVLSRNVIVPADSYPVSTDPNYRYFIPYEPYSVPSYDGRYYDFSVRETPENTSHPLYPVYKQWLVEYVLTKRVVSDIFASVENARRVANASLIDFDLQAMSFAIIIKKQNNITLTDEENQILLSWVTIGSKLIQNKQTESNLKAQITLDQEPDIDAGWQSS